MGVTITRMLAWEVLDSRGTPTVACAVWVEGGASGTASVPSGASTGTHEATERRDGGRRFDGQGVRDAVAAVNGEIASALVGGDASDQLAGTLSDAHTVVKDARAAGYATVLSARSGETEDAWLADLAVGWRTEQIKVGSTTRSERTAKWNRLLRLEAEHPEARFAGRQALTPRGR